MRRRDIVARSHTTGDRSCQRVIDTSDRGCSLRVLSRRSYHRELHFSEPRIERRYVKTTARKRFPTPLGRKTVLFYGHRVRDGVVRVGRE